MIGSKGSNGKYLSSRPSKFYAKWAHNARQASSQALFSHSGEPAFIQNSDKSRNPCTYRVIHCTFPRATSTEHVEPIRAQSFRHCLVMFCSPSSIISSFHFLLYLSSLNMCTQMKLLITFIKLLQRNFINKKVGSIIGTTIIVSMVTNSILKRRWYTRKIIFTYFFRD